MVLNVNLDKLNGCEDPGSLNKAVDLLFQVLLLAITLTITRPWFRLYEDSSGDLHVVD